MTVAMPILRYTYMAAIALGIAVCVYGVSRKAPMMLCPADRRRLRLSQLLGAATRRRALA